MCYSAQCWAAYRAYRREFNAHISIRDFAELYGYKRRAQARVYTPKGMDDAFRDPQTPEEAEVWAIIQELNRGQVEKNEQELFKQRARHVNAERKLATKVTKAAQEDLRISADKMDQAQRRLEDLRRTEPKERDGRIFPFWWAPVMVLEQGRLVVKPMRYHCRLDGWHPGMEAKYGTYNARRTSFAETWRKQFGYQHGVMLVRRFWEHVPKHKFEHRELGAGEKEEDMVLEFNPRPAHDMLVACLWHRSRGFGEEMPEFYSFAAITDEPPPEIAAAGHDRCIIPIRRENMMAWLAPDAGRLGELQEILDDRDRPYYEYHREAA